MIALFGALFAAVAAITALHLRSRPKGGATPFPSFQHLEGLAPRRRPAWPLEEPVRWALRVLAAGLVAGAFFLARREEARPVVVLVEPGAPHWADARALASSSFGVALAMSFEEDGPAVAASPKALEAGERARRTLGSCSATPMACLVRAAGEIDGDPIVVSSFEERRDTFGRLGTFRFLRTAVPERIVPVLEPLPPGATRVNRIGVGNAARIWTAALEVAASEMGGGRGDVTVVDGLEDAVRHDGVVLVPVTSPGTGVRASTVGGAPLTEDAALAAGASALALESTLALDLEASFHPIVAPVLARRDRVIVAAASEDDLGRWAHGPTLVALARIVLFEAGRGVRLTEAPAGGTRRWKGDVPVGLADVAPGRHVLEAEERRDSTRERGAAGEERIRSDGARRVELTVSRDEAPGAARRTTLPDPGQGSSERTPPSGSDRRGSPMAATPGSGDGGSPLTDPELAALRGTRIDSLPEPMPPSRWPLALLVAALAARAIDAPRRNPLVLLSFALGVGLLVLLLMDGSFVRQIAVRRAVLTAGRLSIPDAVRDDGCTRPRAASPCVVTARAALANDPAQVNAIVFPRDRPRVDIVSWELPSEIRVGEAGLLRVTLDVRRAAGKDLKLSARPTSGPSAEASQKMSSDREVVALSLPVRSATEGISFALVTAGVGEPGDAIVVPLVTRAHEARRLVLAAAPGWDARAAGEALAKRGAVERLTRLGTTAVVTRGAGAPSSDGRGALSGEPLDRLSGDLSRIDLIVLVGWSREDFTPARESALSRYVRAGGAILFVGELPRLASLPLPSGPSASSETSILPSRVTGALAGRKVTFLGFPAWKAKLPPAGVALGRLEGVPWIVGRAVGKGRLAAVTAPDAWRVGPEYAALLGDVVAWLEAGRAGPGVTLSPDLRSLSLGGAVTALPASEVGGLPVDPVDPFALLPVGRARARVEARRQRTPFLEADSAPELTSLLSRYPEPAPLPRRVSARHLTTTLWPALAALLVAEVWLRRRAARGFRAGMDPLAG